MLAMLLALAVAAVIYFFCIFVLARQLASAPWSWRILGWAGVPLALGGFGFAFRFWHPTAGPYIANRVYPFGGHLHAWAVSFGFTWVALGLLFTAAVLYVSKQPSRLSWAVLLATWFLCLWPHAIIAIAFAWNGSRQESLRFYDAWLNNPVGLTVLVTSSIEIVLLFVLSVVGFISTGIAVFRRR